ncbi:MAG: hypothetical protein Q9173_002131 [Seirophora scorigena]
MAATAADDDDSDGDGGVSTAKITAAIPKIKKHQPSAPRPVRRTLVHPPPSSGWQASQEFLPTPPPQVTNFHSTGSFSPNTNVLAPAFIVDTNSRTLKGYPDALGTETAN